MCDTTINRIRTLLTPVLDRSGFVVGSGRDTLCPDPLYVIGENPGGGERQHAGPEHTIAASLDSLPEHRNGFVDDGSLTSPFYKNVEFVFQRLGRDPAGVFCTNALFVRSSSSKTNQRRSEQWKLCWPVHQLFLDVVKPKVVLCLGAYAFDRLRVIGGAITSATDPDGPARDGWLRRSARFELSSGQQRMCTLVGIPHPGGLTGNTMWPLGPAALAKLDLVRALISA